MDKHMIQPLERLERLLAARAAHLRSPFLLLVRLYWGLQFIQTGWGKLNNLQRTGEFFSSLELPAPHFTAAAIGCLEFVGGLLLFAGLFSRLVAIPLAIDMIAAYMLANRDALLSVISDPGKFYGADPYTFLFAATLVLIFGPGSLSLDALLEFRTIREGKTRTSLAQAGGA
jgi:putative oxidoreductase